MLIHHTPFRKVPVNTRGRDFFLGDLHGQLHMLEHLLSHVRFNPRRDRLFGVGDLIDRGPSSVEVLTMLRERSWFWSTRGNHEQLLLETCRGICGSWELWRKEGAWFNALPRRKRTRLARIVEGLPLALEVALRDGRRIGVIHAEVAPPGWLAVADYRSWDRAIREHDLIVSAIGLWSRRRAKAAFKLDVYGKGLLKATAMQRLQIWRQREPVPGIDLVISGHTISPRARPVLAANQLFIDTGAYMQKGRLTLVEPLCSRYWQMINPDTNPERTVEDHPLPAPLDFEICAMSADEQRQAEQQEKSLDPFFLALMDLDS